MKLLLQTIKNGQKFDLDALNKEQNKIQKEIGLKFKAKEDASELVKKKDEIVEQKKQLTQKEQDADKQLKFKVNQIGNIVHE